MPAARFSKQQADAVYRLANQSNRLGRCVRSALDVIDEALSKFSFVATSRFLDLGCPSDLLRTLVWTGLRSATTEAKIASCR